MPCDPSTASRRRRSAAAVALVWTFTLVALSVPGAAVSSAQQPPDVMVDPDEIRSVMEDAEAAEPAPMDTPSGIDLLSLITRGGSFMIPIALMSVLVVTLAVERGLSLRSGKVLPRRFARRLRDVATPAEHFDPEAAYQVCAKYRSPAATVVTAMLMRTGQPLGEIERAATEAAQREADRCAAPVRWLNLAAAATPLMGLLGTVWGMIVAFHESTTLTPDRSRSEQLSEGIYTALVTTLAGLAVAIPAAILAQYFENRVTKLFHRIEKLAFDIAPGLARFRSQSRLTPDGSLQPMPRPAAGGSSPVGPPPAPSAPGEPNRPASKAAAKGKRRSAKSR